MNRRFVLAILAGLIFMLSRTVAAAENYMLLNGKCAQLVLGENDYSNQCTTHLFHMFASPERLIFQFFAEKASVTSLAFVGRDGENPSPDTDVTHIHTLIVTTNGQDKEYPAKGLCSFGNPYKGRTTISCSGASDDFGQFNASFFTDGSSPYDFEAGAKSNGQSAQTWSENAPKMHREQEKQNLTVDTAQQKAPPDEDIEQGYGDEEDNKIIAEWGGDFNLTVCNNTKRDVSIAVYMKYNNLVVDPNYVVSGWFKATKDSCSDLGKFPLGDFAFFATDDAGRRWEGKDKRLCIENTRFKRVYFEDYQCNKNEVRGFSRINVTSDTYTINLNR